jgi:GNAT superfamily N-acetyltransferase
MVYALTEQPLQFPYDEAKVERNYLALLSSGYTYCKVLEVDGEIVGVLAGGISDLWWADALIAADQVFFVLPEHRGKGGLKLLKDFIKWAKGFVKVKQICLNISIGGNAADRTDALYDRLGFQRIGSSFILGVDHE